MADLVPTVAGYTAFLRTYVGILVSNLPDNSVFIQDSYTFSMETVNLAIAQASPVNYTRAVYNLATSYLLAWAQDQAGKTFFSDIRTKWNINDFLSGVVESTSDSGTSESMVVQEAAKTFTLANLQALKDPYGRAYLAIAQDYGSLWGLT